MSAKKPAPKRSPIPRSRQSKRRSDSIVPPGFTPEHYVDPKGVRRCGWRCGAIVQDPVTGEWRRCTKVVQKAACDHHRENGRHDFSIPRDRDPGFPATFQERQQQAHLQRGFSRIHDAMARFAGRANISAREASRPPMIDFVREIAATAIQLHGSSEAFQVASIPPISATSLTRRIREQGQAAFDRIIQAMSEQIYFVSILADSGTVLGFSSVHAMVVNPNYPMTVLPLDTFENHQFTGDDYEAFFLAAVDQLTSHHLEVVAIVCDNCPAQLNGVAQALAFRNHLGIIHMPCFNHMTNLVFTHVLADERVSPRMGILNAIISYLLTDVGRHILGQKCPTLVKTRWVYAVDVLRFILERIDEVNTILELQSQDPVPHALKTLYWILLPLKLFSLGMECRSRKLHEVLPLVKEVLREYEVICSRGIEFDDVGIINMLTAHFVARLRINAFEDTVTAWVLSLDGRERIRSQEAHYLSRVGVPSRTDFMPLDCVTEMQAMFRDQFEPWESCSPSEDGGVSIDVIANGLITDPVPTPDVLGTMPEQISEVRATAVARQRSDFRRILDEQLGIELAQRLSWPLDRGAVAIAVARIREMASTLQLDPDQIEAKFSDWLFTRQVTDGPSDPDLHWRKVHSIDESWVAMARIGVRYASIATSEADVERLLSERKDVQGIHGVNFGTQTLDARLLLRYETQE